MMKSDRLKIVHIKTKFKIYTFREWKIYIKEQQVKIEQRSLKWKYDGELIKLFNFQRRYLKVNI